MAAIGRIGLNDLLIRAGMVSKLRQENQILISNMM